MRFQCQMRKKESKKGRKKEKRTLTVAVALPCISELYLINYSSPKHNLKEAFGERRLKLKAPYAFRSF